MTKIYCTVAMKLYYRRLRDFRAGNSEIVVEEMLQIRKLCM